MLVAILTGLVTALFIDRIFFPHQDKAVRDGLKSLAKESNKRIEFYDFIGLAGVYTLDYNKFGEKTAADRKIDQMEKRLDNFGSVIENVVTDSNTVNTSLHDGLHALAQHLKLKFVKFHIAEQKGYKLEKVKKIKK